MQSIVVLFWGMVAMERIGRTSTQTSGCSEIGVLPMPYAGTQHRPTTYSIRRSGPKVITELKCTLSSLAAPVTTLTAHRVRYGVGACQSRYKDMFVTATSPMAHRIPFLLSQLKWVLSPATQVLLSLYYIAEASQSEFM
jgi:hypothetical protein